MRVASRAERVSATAMPYEASFPKETRMSASGDAQEAALIFLIVMFS